MSAEPPGGRSPASLSPYFLIVFLITLVSSVAFATVAEAQSVRHTSIGELLGTVLRADADMPYPDTAGRTLYVDLESFERAAEALGAPGLDVQQALAGAARPFQPFVRGTQARCDQHGCRYTDGNPLIVRIDEVRHASDDRVTVLLDRFFHVYVPTTERYETGCMT